MNALRVFSVRLNRPYKQLKLTIIISHTQPGSNLSDVTAKRLSDIKDVV